MVATPQNPQRFYRKGKDSLLNRCGDTPALDDPNEDSVSGKERERFYYTSIITRIQILSGREIFINVSINITII